VIETTTSAYLRGRAGYTDQCDAMMLVVICDKSQHGIAVGYVAAQEGCIEICHAFEVRCLQDNMGKHRWRKNLSPLTAEVRHCLARMSNVTSVRLNTGLRSPEWPESCGVVFDKKELDVRVHGHSLISLVLSVLDPEVVVCSAARRSASPLLYAAALIGFPPFSGCGLLVETYRQASITLQLLEVSEQRSSC
jgi:hypothetical protein